MSYLNGRGKFVVAVVIILVLLYALSDPYGLRDTDFIGNVKENSDRMLEKTRTEDEPYEENNIEEQEESEEENQQEESEVEQEETQDEEESGNGFKFKKVYITEGCIHKYDLKEEVEEEIEWASDNKKVASVNSSGMVVAKSHGIANITATVSGETFSCEVLVAPKLEEKDFKIYNQSESNSVKNYSDGNGCIYNEFTIDSGNFLDGERFAGVYQHDFYCRVYEEYDETLKDENRGILIGESTLDDVLAAYGIRYASDGPIEGVKWDDNNNTEYVTYDFVYDGTYYYKRFYFNEDGTVELIKWFTGRNNDEEWS